MNILTPIQTGYTSPQTSPQGDAARAEKPVREKVRQIDQVEVLPANISDLEFQAQQQAEKKGQQREQSRETNAFLQTQDLEENSTVGRFIDIRV